MCRELGGQGMEDGEEKKANISNFQSNSSNLSKLLYEYNNYVSDAFENLGLLV